MPSDTLPAIPFAKEYVEPILAGEKTVTFRLDSEHDLEPCDRVRLQTEDAEEIDTATIVTQCELSAGPAANAGFRGHQRYDGYPELLDHLAEYYALSGNLGPHEPIDVIAFLPDSVAAAARTNDHRRYGTTQVVDDRDENPAAADPELRCDGGPREVQGDAVPAVDDPDRGVGTTVASRVHFDLVAAIRYEADVGRDRAAEIAETCLDDIEDVVEAAITNQEPETRLLDDLNSAVRTAEELGLNELAADIGELYQVAGKDVTFGGDSTDE